MRGWTDWPCPSQAVIDQSWKTRDLGQLDIIVTHVWVRIEYCGCGVEWDLSHGLERISPFLTKDGSWQFCGWKYLDLREEIRN